MPDSNPRPHVEPMQAAIQATLTAIQNRARLYRNLVIGVSLVIVATAALALVFRSGIPLVGLSLLVPVVGAYFVVDSRQTRQWSGQILEWWSEGKLNLTAFSAAMTAHPYVPRGTLEGMLGLLPIESDKPRQASLPAAQRKSIALKIDRLARWHQKRIVAATAGLMSLVVFSIAAVLVRSVWLAVLAVVSLGVWLLAIRSS